MSAIWGVAAFSGPLLGALSESVVLALGLRRLRAWRTGRGGRQRCGPAHARRQGDHCPAVSAFRERGSAPRSGRTSSELTAERIDTGTTLAIGDRVRLTLESPGAGFVRDRPRQRRKMSEPYLIFPTTRTRSGDNAVRGGKLIDIPDPEIGRTTLRCGPAVQSDWRAIDDHRDGDCSQGRRHHRHGRATVECIGRLVAEMMGRARPEVCAERR